MSIRLVRYETEVYSEHFCESFKHYAKEVAKAHPEIKQWAGTFGLSTKTSVPFPDQLSTSEGVLEAASPSIVKASTSAAFPWKAFQDSSRPFSKGKSGLKVAPIPGLLATALQTDPEARLVSVADSSVEPLSREPFTASSLGNSKYATKSDNAHKATEAKPKRRPGRSSPGPATASTDGAAAAAAAAKAGSPATTSAAGESRHNTGMDPSRWAS